MSSTGRGSERLQHDAYCTPAWPVRRLLEKLELPGGYWLEPSAGTGDIIRAVNAVRKDVCWDTVEIRKECEQALNDAVQGSRFACSVNIRDFLTFKPPTDPWVVCIGNPPYSDAEAFIRHGLELAHQVVYLLRLNFLESEARADWLRELKPDVYVLPNRPSFVIPHGKRAGATDSTAYAWMRFRRDPRLRMGLCRILASTPRADRAAPKRTEAPPPKKFPGRCSDCANSNDPDCAEDLKAGGEGCLLFEAFKCPRGLTAEQVHDAEESSDCEFCGGFPYCRGECSCERCKPKEA